LTQDPKAYTSSLITALQVAQAKALAAFASMRGAPVLVQP
jgi:hypothetical protein